MSPPGRGVLVYEYRHEYARRKHKETFRKTPPMYSLLVNADWRTEPRGDRPFQEAKGKLQRIPLRPDSEWKGLDAWRERREYLTAGMLEISRSLSH